ncbi:MAG: hypothetical protein QME52_03960 [Bacteroidota bacterium]|nr:hypothetical protein [Bacteroidota bacterium]
MHLRIIWILIFSIIFISCDKNTEPEGKTAAQLLAEGWQAYQGKDYQLAQTRFSEALTKDANLVDAINGLGWTNAKLNKLDSAMSKFLFGLNKDTTNLEMKAGLAFVYNARKNYSSSNELALAILQSNPTWSFSKDASINFKDVQLLVAKNFFAIANYTQSLAYVKLLNPKFNEDVSTVAGQTALAKEIEILSASV